MRLDAKYFTPFLAVTTVVTMLVILYATISYLNHQQETVHENLSEMEVGQLVFDSLLSEESLSVGSFSGQPVVIHFWATWSGKSETVADVLDQVQDRYPGLVVVAASVRDHPELAREWARAHQETFRWVEGTDLYQALQIPGVPSQLLINRRGRITSLHVGDEASSLKQELETLVADE